MAVCKSMLEDGGPPQDDLQCVICLEPLQEARRFSCFHLLCTTCAQRHVAACLSVSEGERLAFGPVFCPQCREVCYVWPAVGRHLPECTAVADARSEAQKLLVALDTVKGEDEEEEEKKKGETQMQAAGEEIDEKMAKVLSSVRSLLREERELQESVFEWAADSDLVSGQVAFTTSEWKKPVKALSALRAEFGTQVADLLSQRAAVTRLLEQLFRRKWVLAALNAAGAAKAWTEFEARCAEEEEEAEEAMEAEETEIEKMEEEKEDEEEMELFLLSAIFRSHRPYPGAVLPEQRVKAGQIHAELVWRSGERGSERGNFNWPIHAVFIDDSRIAVADKNNKRVQLLDRATGRAQASLFEGRVIPRRVHRHKDLLLVSDELSATVKAFHMDSWKLKTKFGQGLFLCPTGVAQKSNGSLLYTDMDRGIVSSHDGDSLEFEYRWTCRLLSDRYVPSPAFLTVDADDYIFIADSQNNCIKVFKPNGGIVARFGSDQLCCPRGIVADPLGHLFVVDSDHHRICVFDPFGKFLQELALPIKLDYPMSLDYLPQERLLLVTQCSFMHYNHCVMLFKVHYDHEMKENLSVLLPANC